MPATTMNLSKIKIDVDEHHLQIMEEIPEINLSQPDADWKQGEVAISLRTIEERARKIAEKAGKSCTTQSMYYGGTIGTLSIILTAAIILWAIIKKTEKPTDKGKDFRKYSTARNKDYPRNQTPDG